LSDQELSLVISWLKAAGKRAPPSSPIRVDWLAAKTQAILGEQTMAENEVVSNQTAILGNQATIVKNQKAILGNQATIVKNQKTILANQGAIKKNQSALNQILKNQKQILAALKK
jgi:hypothetical protein